MVPVIIAQSPCHIVFIRRGLIPHWTKNAKMAYKMINARGETLTQLHAFRGLGTGSPIGLGHAMAVDPVRA